MLISHKESSAVLVDIPLLSSFDRLCDAPQETGDKLQATMIFLILVLTPELSQRFHFD